MNTEQEYKIYLASLSENDLHDILNKIDGERYPQKKRLVEAAMLTFKQADYGIKKPSYTHSKSSLEINSFIKSISSLYFILLLISIPIIVYYLNPNVAQPSTLAITIISFLFIISGSFIVGIQQLYLLGLAFQKSTGIGIICFMIPFATLALISEDQEATKAFIKGIFGIPFLVTGILIMILIID